MNLERVENISEAIFDKSKDAVSSMNESVSKLDELSSKEKIDTAINWVKDNPGKSAIIGLGLLVSMKSRTVRGAAMWVGACLLKIP